MNPAVNFLTHRIGKKLGVTLLGFLVLTCPLMAKPTATTLQNELKRDVLPFIETYCVSCHDTDEPKGDLNLTVYTNLQSVTDDFRRWESVLERLKSNEMPPPKARRHPQPQAMREIIRWIESAMKYEADRNAGDPGVVLARRLSNAEYHYTVRDLTGADINPTKEFPVDPANTSGFDNTGESLAMSPSLVKKYMEASRLIADHLVLKPDGFSFASHPTLTDTDRDKYAVKQIVQFYRRQPTNYTDYFFASWSFKHRASLGRKKDSLVTFAHEHKISPKYLGIIWKALNETPPETGPMAVLHKLWQKLPAPDGASNRTEVRKKCEEMTRFVCDLRQQVKPYFHNLTVRGVHEGSQSLVLWKDRQYAVNRTNYLGGALDIHHSRLPIDGELARIMMVPDWEQERERKDFDESFRKFCAIFPDAFFILERARVYLKEEEERSNIPGRFLSAGFHSQIGYFRDDGPLCDMLLDEAEKNVLDRLWQELNFITAAPKRQHRDFLWFERTDSRFMLGEEFEFARPEDKDSTSEEKIRKLSDVYLAKVERSSTNELAINAIRRHFEDVSKNIRALEKAQIDAEPAHLAALQKFTEKAYRRPVSQVEKTGVLDFYQYLREKEGLTHEEAMRDSVAGILMSPHFLYRVSLPASGKNVEPLSDFDLAGRLSYFLWSSMPDEELLNLAATGKLRQPGTLTKQTARMLKDQKARALAVEFAGNWLDFRRFEEHNSVDRERFPEFNNELRQAMFEEPVRFILDLVQNNGPMTDLLFGRHTFVNETLARHYGIPFQNKDSKSWIRVPDADQFGRGGILPMSLFMTQNAPGLRTSPVKRGYWVVRRLLGEHIPAPPPSVPELPADEAKLGELTLRETLARHRQDKTCSGCHEKFDSIGLVFEGYGAVGERRTKDFGGRPVEISAIFPGGTEGAGVDGLKVYLKQKRQDDFLNNICRKMLSYGLGRALLLSDEQTVKTMRKNLERGGFSFSVLVESVVTSPQFLNRRDQINLSKQ